MFKTGSHIARLFLFIGIAQLSCLAIDKIAAADRVVAVTSDIAPGTNSVFGNLGGPYVGIGNGGVAAFTSQGNEGIWSELGGNLDVVALAGLPAAGTNAEFMLPFASRISNSGGFGFSAGLTGDGIIPFNDSGIWEQRADGSVRLVVQKGDDVDGGTFLAAPEVIHVAGNGNTTFSGRAYISNTIFRDQAVWTENSGQIELIAATNQTAPGTTGVWSSLGFPRADDNGAVAINGRLLIDHQTNVTIENDRGVWAGNSGSVELVAREGDQAPNRPNDVEFSSFFGAKVSSNGAAVFRGDLRDRITLLETGGGVWSTGTGSLQMVAGQGDQPQGVPDGAVFGFDESFQSFARAFDVSDDGRVVLQATLKVGTGGVELENNRGIWEQIDSPSDELSLVVREGDLLPGSTTEMFSELRQMHTNGSNQIAFEAAASAPFTTTGIWAQDVNNELQLIAQNGDFIDLGPGIQPLSIVQVSLTDISDDGHVAYWALLSNFESALIVSDVVAIPESSGINVIMLFLFGAFNQSRRTRH